jgi:hypothetical protein
MHHSYGKLEGVCSCSVVQMELQQGLGRVWMVVRGGSVGVTCGCPMTQTLALVTMRGARNSRSAYRSLLSTMQLSERGG